MRCNAKKGQFAVLLVRYFIGFRLCGNTSLLSSLFLDELKILLLVFEGQLAFLIGFWLCQSVLTERDILSPISNNLFSVIAQMSLFFCNKHFFLAFYFPESVFEVASISVWGKWCRLFLYFILLFCHLCINNHKSRWLQLLICRSHMFPDF